MSMEIFHYGNRTAIFYDEPYPKCEACGKPVWHRIELEYAQEAFVGDGVTTQGVGAIVDWLNLHYGLEVSGCEGRIQRGLIPLQLDLFTGDDE